MSHTTRRSHEDFVARSRMALPLDAHEERISPGYEVEYEMAGVWVRSVVGGVAPGVVFVPRVESPGWKKVASCRCVITHRR